MSKIEWTEKTWNPITGCTKISPGCDNCYAEKMAKRLKGMGNDIGTSNKYGNGFNLTCHHDVLFSKSGNSPIKRQKPTVYFVNSMSDTFHENVRYLFLRDLYFVMMDNLRHTFIILTKRADRMANFFSPESCFKKPDMPNIYHGVTICNQAEADKNVPQLLKVPGKLFLNIEPMLGPIDLMPMLEHRAEAHNDTGIDQVIAGCEGGPNRRQSNPDWFRSLRDQCQAAGVPFMLKQMEIDGKVVKMPELDGQIHNELIWGQS